MNKCNILALINNNKTEISAFIHEKNSFLYILEMGSVENSVLLK